MQGDGEEEGASELKIPYTAKAARLVAVAAKNVRRACSRHRDALRTVTRPRNRRHAGLGRERDQRRQGDQRDQEDQVGQAQRLQRERGQHPGHQRADGDAAEVGGGEDDLRAVRRLRCGRARRVQF